MRNFTICVEDLEQYNFFRIEKNKKDHKLSTIQLAVELKVLRQELDAVKQA